MYRYIVVILLMLNTLQAQDVLRLNDITIVGNKRTNERIILREIDLKPGDQISKDQLEDILSRIQSNIFNTRLFVTVEVKPVYISGNTFDIYILVNERWYFFPTPIFELVDRNFNHWWVNENADLSRTIYGLRLTQRNLTGNNDILQFRLQFGFTNQYGFQYSLPYIDREQKLGVRFDFRYLNNNRFIYNTASHRQLNIRAERIIREEIQSSMFFTYRPALYHFHEMGIGFYRLAIDDSVAQLNPNYLLNGRTQLQYFQFNYNYRFDKTDNVAYPLNGWLAKFELQQLGLGLLDPVSLTTIWPSLAYYHDLGGKFYLATGTEGKISSRAQQPYYEFRAQGFGNSLLRGYELYVLEGQHMGLWKSDIKYQLLDVKPSLGDWMPVKQFREFPFSMYVKAFADVGYVVNTLSYPEDQFLANKPIYSAGLGLDLITFYDGVFRLEGAYNSLGDFRFGVNVKLAID